MEALAALNSVELTEEEYNLAIYYAKKEKKRSLDIAAYNEKIRQEASVPKFKSEEFAEFIFKKENSRRTKLGLKPFVVDKQVEELFWTLALYFNNDKRVEEFGISLNKGILIFGNVGVGKTELLRIFSENPKESFVVKSCIKVTDDYSDHGFEEGLSIYCNHYKSNGLIGQLFNHKDLAICFDDLGTEDMTRHYGNVKNVLADILQRRYDKKLTTHITTNLNAKTIKESYGDRVASRMKESFNLLSFPEDSIDRRK